MADSIASVYTDFSGLKSLSAKARLEPNEAAKEVAQQFESIFIEIMMKSMRSATPKDSLFGSDQMEAYQDIFDKQLAVDMAESGGLGIAEVIQRQIMHLQGLSTEVETDRTQ